MYFIGGKAPGGQQNNARFTPAGGKARAGAYLGGGPHYTYTYVGVSSPGQKDDQPLNLLFLDNSGVVLFVTRQVGLVQRLLSGWRTRGRPRAATLR